MPTGFHFSAMDRVPQHDFVRIGYRYRDFLEGWHCRTCGQKTLATAFPFIMGLVYMKEY
jgi:hypothetical protein